MTMTLRIKNESRDYVARIENCDEYAPQDGVRNIVVSTQARLKPGEETVVYATSSRSIRVYEERLSPIDTIETEKIMGEGDDSLRGTGSG